MDVELLINQIVDSAYRVHRALHPGYLESVYRNALVLELSSRGMESECEVPIIVRYRGHVVGDFKADVLVEDKVILELKAVNSLHEAHEAQLVNYLTATGIEYGFLINFGSEKVEIKRKFRTYRPKLN